MNAADVEDPNRGSGGCEDLAQRASASTTNAVYAIVVSAIGMGCNVVLGMKPDFNASVMNVERPLESDRESGWVPLSN